jgi:uncharacterized protein
LIINDVIYSDSVIDKLRRKHGINISEVEEAIWNNPKVKKAQKGQYKDEDVYYAYGRTNSGRYLIIVFICKKNKDALIVTARDMDTKERQYYGRK